MGLRRASQEGGGQGTALEAQGAMWMPCQGSPQSIWGEPRELPLASLYLHFPSSCPGVLPTASRHCPAQGKREDSVPPPQLLRTIKLRTAIS